MVHAARRPSAAGPGTEAGAAAKGRGRRHEEIALGGRPRRRRRGLAAAERHVAQARRGRRGGGRRGREQPFLGGRRREQAARTAFLDRGHRQRTVTAAAVAAERLRCARHAPFGHRGGRGRAHGHRQHGPAGPRRAALVLHQRLDVGRRLGLARTVSHQRAVGRQLWAASARQRPAASKHRVLSRAYLQRPVCRLDRLEYGRRLQAAVHVEFRERCPVLKTKKKITELLIILSLVSLPLIIIVILFSVLFIQISGNFSGGMGSLGVLDYQIPSLTAEVVLDGLSKTKFFSQ